MGFGDIAPVFYLMGMFELFTHGYTFLNLLSFLAFITTVGLFFCGIPICRQIWKRKDTDEISGAPFLMGIVGGCCWMAYGILKKDDTVLYVTGCQVVLYSTYSVFYWVMTKKKLWITLKIVAVITVVTTLFTLVHIFGKRIYHPLGIVCMTLNAADFAAPLGGLRVVIRRRATSTLPLPLCIANFLVSSEWFLYGLLVKDFYLITPNGIGSIFAIIQLVLFIVLPRKPGQKAPIVRLWNCFRGNKVVDVEDPRAEIVPELGAVDDEEKKISRGDRWSKKFASSVSTVAEELENVISRVGHDQFAYAHPDEDTSSEKTAETPTHKKSLPMITEANEIKSAEAELPRRESKASISSASSNLRRAFSSPNLS